mgnify:CR=1 FL=1
MPAARIFHIQTPSFFTDLLCFWKYPSATFAVACAHVSCSSTKNDVTAVWVVVWHVFKGACNFLGVLCVCRFFNWVGRRIAIGKLYNDCRIVFNGWHFDFYRRYIQRAPNHHYQKKQRIEELNCSIHMHNSYYILIPTHNHSCDTIPLHTSRKHNKTPRHMNRRCSMNFFIWVRIFNIFTNRVTSHDSNNRDWLFNYNSCIASWHGFKNNPATWQENRNNNS